MQNNFFGSKLNTVLLFVLIILVVIAIRLMLENKETYLPFMQNQETKTNAVYQISGNKDDLVSFSILPGSKVSGIIKLSGSVKNAYFFEGNILVNIVDTNEKVLKVGHGTATSEWATTGPVSFEATLDFSGLPKGSAYIEIRNDNPSGISANDKSILIPVNIE